tara:strand:+ start:1670 stop:2134 length:465 start_codon:yes stop_codon:yes gene_type:complete
MKLEVLRFSSDSDSTLGMLFDITDNCRKFLCFTLEDEHRDIKIMGETRIPAGCYTLKLRKEGGFHNRYAYKYGIEHKGMIHVQDVPGFEYILWHTGNTDKDTAGCLLLGDTSQQNITKQGFISNSTTAYKRVYPSIASALELGEEVKVEYIDFS